MSFETFDLSKVENIQLLDGDKFYYISTHGNVYSNTGRGLRGRVRNFLSLMSPRIGRSGYYIFSGLKSRPITRTIHRLVLETFVPNLEKKADCNHKDGNRTNNHISNLEWATRKENMRHMYRELRGTHSKETVQRILDLKDGGARNIDIARMLGLNLSIVSGFLFQRRRGTLSLDWRA